MSETDVVTRGDLADAVDTFFDRVRDYFPPPVFVGRGQANMVSVLVALIVLYISLRPAMKLKEQATNPMEEITAIGVIVACVIITLIVQRIVAGAVYNFSMLDLNRQHFANKHWVSEYSKAKVFSPL
tara:strand:- start:674 stop:1054 length:381 start_codon:yes stop_codon:yes gene_type:complete